MLYTPPNSRSTPSKSTSFHFCRNSHCRSELPTPVENQRSAFCAPHCKRTFYRRRCVVCEAEKPVPRQPTCGQRECKRALRKYPHFRVFAPTKVPRVQNRRLDAKSARFMRVKTAPLADRPLHVVAVPLGLVPAPINLRIPLDPEIAGAAHRKNLATLRKSLEDAEQRAQIKRGMPPVNLLGGFCFPGAPAVDLSPIDPPAEWAIPSRWTPTRTSAVCPPVPDFLKRTVPAAVTRPVAEEADPCPGRPRLKRRVGELPCSTALPA
jgi:hypothetical protein